VAETKKGGAKKPSVFVRFANYIKDVRTEMKRVVWPQRSDVIHRSGIVVATLIFFVILTFIVDTLSSTLIIDIIGGMGR
jgi:preprotein translocase subunit SecE